MRKFSVLAIGMGALVTVAWAAGQAGGAPSSAKPSAPAAAKVEPTFSWPERPAGAKAGVEGAFLRVTTSFFNGRMSTSFEGWFFTRDGRVAQNPKGGVALANLAQAPRARKSDGVYWIEGDKLKLGWANNPGKVREEKFAPEGDDLRIGGLMATRQQPFPRGWRTAATYHGIVALAGAGGLLSSSNTLVFRADGTFAREDFAAVSASTAGGRVGHAVAGNAAGSYEFDGFTLTLRLSDGTVSTFTVFPFGERDGAGAPEYLWRDGSMMNRNGVEKR